MQMDLISRNGQALLLFHHFQLDIIARISLLFSRGFDFATVASSGLHIDTPARRRHTSRAYRREYFYAMRAFSISASLAQQM